MAHSVANRRRKLCRKCSARSVGSRNRSQAKLLRTLERVKGIEPSYSAWKAAALPLSYTRAGADLTRHAGGLNPPRAALFSLQNGPVPPAPIRSGPLTGADSPPILVFPSTQRKEVIQCLLRSAVTSLGSPARPLSLRPGIGALSALDQRAQELERGGSHPAALSCWGLHDALVKQVLNEP